LENNGERRREFPKRTASDEHPSSQNFPALSVISQKLEEHGVQAGQAKALA
jgi:hypothetical protein